MENLHVISYNVNGLKNDKKRGAIFNWLRSKGSDIILLQETHCHLRKERYKWGKEWNGKSLWSMGSSHSKGVTVLFKEKMDLEITEQIIDPNGRYVVFKLKTSNGTYKVFNIYAPVNEYERVIFFNDISVLLDNNDESVEIIIGGDYNCTLNNAMDRYNCTSNIDIGQIDLKNVMGNFYLEDIWRRRNPDVKQFSWEGRGKKSRIDYFLVSKSLDGQIENVQYINAPFSDHSVVYMKIRTTDIKTGKGIWKMNVQTIKTDLF